MNKRIVLSLITLLAYSSLEAFKHIEKHKKEIAGRLQHHNPTALTIFNQLCIQYDHVVTAFFDKHNNLSLTQHICTMEKDLAVLAQTAYNPAFVSAQVQLIELSHEVQDLIALLKEYRSSKNSVSLAWKVRRFKKLLPNPINKWSDYSLFWALHHRLYC